MNISAKIIADSISEVSGKRLTTLQVTLPKCLLAEANTVRVFSRNYSSARAVPTSKFSQLDTFQPLYYGKNKSGMEAELEEIDNKEEAEKIWNDAIEYCKNASLKLANLGLHKQWSNRVTDWFVMAQGIISATEWDNFFLQRIHHSAQPEMCLLATKMKEAMDNSIPVIRKYQDWHLPYILDEEREEYKNHEDIYILQKISSARCCRVSYLNHEGKKTIIDEDLKLFNRLAGSNPKHYSPLEHIGTPDILDNQGNYGFSKYHGNFDGWIQFRKLDEDNLV